jgi:regulator of replication initiation timing
MPDARRLARGDPDGDSRRPADHPPPAQSPDIRRLELQIQSLQTENASLRQQIQTLQERAASPSPEIARLTAENERLRDELGRANASVSIFAELYVRSMQSDSPAAAMIRQIEAVDAGGMPEGVADSPEKAALVAGNDQLDPSEQALLQSESAPPRRIVWDCLELTPVGDD